MTKVLGGVSCVVATLAVCLVAAGGCEDHATPCEGLCCNLERCGLRSPQLGENHDACHDRCARTEPEILDALRGYFVATDRECEIAPELWCGSSRYCGKLAATVEETFGGGSVALGEVKAIVVLGEANLEPTGAATCTVAGATPANPDVVCSAPDEGAGGTGGGGAGPGGSGGASAWPAIASLRFFAETPTDFLPSGARPCVPVLSSTLGPLPAGEVSVGVELLLDGVDGPKGCRVFWASPTWVIPGAPTTAAVVLPDGALQNCVLGDDGSEATIATCGFTCESTLATCSDGIDNDGDSRADCQDAGCTQFAHCLAPP